MRAMAGQGKSSDGGLSAKVKTLESQLTALKRSHGGGGGGGGGGGDGGEEGGGGDSGDR